MNVGVNFGRGIKLSANVSSTVVITEVLSAFMEWLEKNEKESYEEYNCTYKFLRQRRRNAQDLAPVGSGVHVVEDD